ncbi:MAG: hypothetical protein P8Z40_09750 [Chloroflexota bacterium]
MDTSPNQPSPAAKIALIAVLAVYVLLNVGYALAFPIFESWDEPHHYEYVRYLIEQRRLPIQYPGGGQTEFHQPPAYYAVTALLTAYLPADSYTPEANPAFGQESWHGHNQNAFIHPRAVEGWPWRGTALNVHLMRLLSVGWGLVSLLAVWHLSARLQPDEPGGEWLRVGAVALTAFNPTFLVLMGSINSMVLATAIGAGLALALVDVATRGLNDRLALATGALFGLAALTRWTMAPFLASFLGAVVVSRAAWKRPWRAAGWTLITLLVGASIAGWWSARSIRLYGDPLALSVLYDSWGEGRPVGAPSMLSGVPTLLSSYWGSFGPWGSIALPDWVHWLLLMFTFIGMGGLAWRWIDGKLSADAKRAIFVLGSITVGTFVFAVIAGSQSRFGVQQRWLVPGHPAAMVVLALGWWHILSGERLLPWARISWGVLPLILSVGSLFWVILPAYAPPQTVDDPALLDYQTGYDVTVGDFARLIGVSVPSRAEPGQRATIRVCWETLKPTTESYWLFVQLVGANQQRLAGIDSVPGRGNYPTTDWTAGLSHCTDWPVLLPPDAPPGLYTVQVGLYERESLHRLEATLPSGSGRPGTPFNPPIVGQVLVEASPGDPPAEAETVDADFGGAIRLRAVRMPEAIRPGDAPLITLYWEALSPPPQPYTVYIHLAEPGDPASLLAQSDGPPRDGLYPTDLWPVGALVPDAHRLTLPADLPGGVYELRIGLYDLASGARLPGPEPDGSFALPLRVIGP